jgi:Protein of unknown function (DUF2877)
VIAARPALGRQGRVAGVGREAAYVDAGGFIVVLTVQPPVLPNGAQVSSLPAMGDEVIVHASEVWDPTLRLGDPPAVDAPDDDLARAVAARDPSLAAAAGAQLIGRGSGLTPEGDDVVCGAAAVVAVGPWPQVSKEAWVRALVGDDLRRRTTALSATLLELAAGGMGPEPLQAWLAGEATALARLEAIGHSTGRAIARGAATALNRLRPP